MTPMLVGALLALSAPALADPLDPACVDAPACGKLADSLEQSDPTRARTLHQLACMGGYWYSCNDLTVLYGDPLGEQQNRKKFEAECEGGSASSCYWIGARLLSGFGGLPKEEERGKSFLVRSCDGGYGTACYTLGSPLIYADPPDVDGWLRWMDKGCKGGSPDACAELKTPLSDWRELCSQGIAGGCEMVRRKQGVP